MPKKSHRVASRQAQLGQKKRKGRPQVYVPAERPEPLAQEGAKASARTEMTAVATEARPVTARQPSRKEKVQATPVNPLAAYSYVWDEIKWIGMVTVLILIILGVLTIFLR